MRLVQCASKVFETQALLECEGACLKPLLSRRVQQSSLPLVLQILAVECRMPKHANKWFDGYPRNMLPAAIGH